MTEYSDRVEEVRHMREAEKWANEVRDIHVHSLDSMWYETEESRKLTNGRGVIDTTYNNGRVVRKIADTGKEFTIKPGLTGEDLYRKYVRAATDRHGMGNF